MTRIGLWLVIAFSILTGASALEAQDLGSQRLAVPLTNPDQPVVLSASLVQGTITVEAYDGAEVIVEAVHRKDDDHEECDDCDDDSDEDGDEDGDQRRSAGLRRIPNMNIGLTLEERDNRVQVASESWNRRVELHIQVPRRTSLRLSTVNGGDLQVSGVEGEHELQNTNGGISALDVRGSVVANTTNGDIEIRLLQVAPDKAMSFTTWNGDVDVSFPATTSGVLLLNPGRGDIYTDFDLKLEPVQAEIKSSPRREGYRVEMKQEVKGVLGAGGPEMHFRTFNGSVYVRKIK